MFQSLYKQNFSSQGENILNIELDLPNRTTKDYEGPTVAPRVQAALDAALQGEDDIDIDGGSVKKWWCIRVYGVLETKGVLYADFISVKKWWFIRVYGMLESIVL